MRRSRRTLSPKPGVSHSCSVSPCGVRSISCASANSVTCGASRTSPTSRPSSVRASVVLPTLVCDTRLSCRLCGASLMRPRPRASAAACSCCSAASAAARSAARRSTNSTGMPSRVGQRAPGLAPLGAARRGGAEALHERGFVDQHQRRRAPGAASARSSRPWLSASGVAPRSNSAMRSAPSAGVCAGSSSAP